MGANKEDVQVVIVGGGIAGLAAASRLLDNGFRDVLILEAEDRLGGRVKTVPFGESQIDLGAHWIGGEIDNPIYQEVGHLKLLKDSKDFKNLHFILDDGCRLDKEKGDELFSLVNAASKDYNALKDFKGNLAEYFEAMIKPNLSAVSPEDWFVTAFINWVEKFKCLERGCNSLKEASTSTLSQFHNCEGVQNLIWREGGFETLLKVLLKTHPSTLNVDGVRITCENIKLRAVVKEIKWSGHRLVIKCLNDEMFYCDHVIVTVSLGVLKEKLKSLFKPSLPYLHSNAINGLGIGTVDKIFLKYETQWWPDNCSGFCFLETRESPLLNGETNWEREIVGFFTECGAPCVLSAWVVGAAAIQMEQCSEDEIAKACTRCLRRFLSTKYNIPEPQFITRSQWYSNPHFRGSYSYRSMESDRFAINTSVLALPVINWGRPLILFAGEATSEKFFSTAHGALETGWRAADKLIDFYKTTEIHQPTAIIIGAGIAGLAAARTLSLAGVDKIKILEAQPQPGGRAQSVEFGGGIAELGAQWFHCSNNTLFQIAKKNELISSVESVEGSGVYLRPNGEVVPHNIVEEVKREVERILFECEKFNSVLRESKFPIPSSVGSYLVDEFQKYLETDEDPFIKGLKKELLDWHVRFQVIDNSCLSLEKLSAAAWGQYKCEGQNLLNLKRGYSSLINSILTDLPSGCIETSCPVKTIKWKPNLESTDYTSCEVICEDGRSYQTNHVIVSSSIGYLKSNPEMFDPPLPPSHLNALKSIGFDTINKIFLEYNEPWWNNLEGIQLVYNSFQGIFDFSDDEMNWTKGITGFDQVENLTGVLLVWVGGEGALAMERLSKEKVALHCTVLLRKFTGNDIIPLPSNIIRSCWGSNKYICGSYSHITVKADKLNKNPISTLTMPVFSQIGDSLIPSLIFAGEALHSSNFSTTHGAYDSGECQGRLLLDYFKSSENVNKDFTSF